MIKKVIAITIVVLLSSCSLLRNTQQKEEIRITDNQLNEWVSQSVQEILNDAWLTNFLTDNNERPILIISGIISPENIILNASKLYDKFDLELLNTGQVRIVKSTLGQRSQIPAELASGESVDYVLVPTITEEVNDKTYSYYFTISLWGNDITSPIFTSKKIKVDTSSN